jgi:hypothetical protein
MKSVLKRTLCVILPMILVMTMPTGCTLPPEKGFTCEDLIRFYEENGYSVEHTEQPESEDGCQCSVEIQEENGKYIRFRFFESHNQAHNYADERDLPWILQLICNIFGIQPSRTVGAHWQAAYECNSETLYALFDQFTITPNYLRDSFFSEEWLTNCHIEDMPVPKLENSRLVSPLYGSGDWLYYGNLTREEFDAYVLTLVDYLKTRQDIFFPSYYYDHRLELGIAPVDIFTAFGETYDASKDFHRFAFSANNTLDRGNITDPFVIEVTWEEATLDVLDFSYNTTVKICDWYSDRIGYDPCAAAHHFDEGRAYPVPGLDRQVTVRSCIHCGHQAFSEYIGSENRELYAVTVTEGRAHILRNNWNQVQSWDIDSLYAGQILEIATPIPENGTMQMLVNGESIPVLYTEGNTQTFGFIMPEADVEIQIRIITNDEE